jgi:hypothetical protein
VRGPSGETLVEVAGLDRSSRSDLSDDLTAFVALLQGKATGAADASGAADATDTTAGDAGVQEDQ